MRRAFIRCELSTENEFLQEKSFANHGVSVILSSFSLSDITHIMKRLFAFILLLFGIHEAPAEVLRGRCSYVQDGDSLKFVQQGHSEEVRVRLYGIDAPEKNQEFSGQSRKKLEKLTRGKKIRLEVVEKDQYGRYVAKVYVGKTYVNLEMVKAGLAWHYDFHADAKADSDLAQAEEAARNARKGVWSSDTVVNPREHRRTHGTVHSEPVEQSAEEPSATPVHRKSAHEAKAEFPTFPAGAQVLYGVCRHVQDGDSLRLVEEGAAEDTIIQLHGVDAPERYMPYAEEARALAKKLAEKQQIAVVVETVDRYGRTVGRVYVGNTCLNEQLIRAGVARCHGKYADPVRDADLWAAQQAAQEARVGLWK